MNETEKKKIFMMRVIIGSVAFIILILWGFNLKNVWQDNRSDKKASSEWTGLKSDLEKTLAEAQEKLNKLEEKKILDDKQAGDKFLADMIEETEKIASSSAVTASSTSEIEPVQKSDSSCPEYINCMPTIGEARSCVVPLGCEGITIIAY